MEKRYQVFVSSTYEDLKEERQEVIQALLELDCIPAGMELFPAADEDQWTLIKKVINDCDYYIVILGGRYGSRSESGISYTQMEYDYAVSQGKPVLAFLHKNPGEIKAYKTEQSEEGKAKLKEFREILEKRVCKYWNNPEELGSVISRSLIKLIKTTPAIGWVRGNIVPDENTSQEILKLRKQVEELTLKLEKANSEAPKGTEVLAQGEDTFQLYYTFDIYSGDNWPTITTTYEASFTTTWNELFANIAPIMINEATEQLFFATLNTFIKNHETKELTTTMETSLLNHTIATNAEIRYIQARHEDFQTIKIQFRALGLIKQGERQRSRDDSNTYWKLTPYGDNIMTQLRAIRKEHRIIQDTTQPN